MKTSKFSVLRVAQVLFAAVTAESPVVAFLSAISFPLEWLAQGEAMLVRAFDLRDRREGLRRTVRGMTSAVRSVFHGMSSEVSTFLAAAKRALAQRQDLAATLGVAGKRRETATDPQPPASGAPPAAPPAKRKRVRKTGVTPFLEKARGALGAALASDEVASILAPYGYGREAIEGLLARVESFARMELEHEELKKALLGTSKDLDVRLVEFRGWFIPSRKRLNTALKPRPELQKMLTEPQE